MLPHIGAGSEDSFMARKAAKNAAAGMIARPTHSTVNVAAFLTDLFAESSTVTSSL